MFSIKKESFGKTLAYHLRNTDTEEYVVIVPSYGAIVNAWFVRTQTGLVNIIDGYVDDHDFKLNNESSYKSNFLFPFPNRTANGIYSFKHTEYQLPLNFPQENNAIHGLVYDQDFKVIATNESSQEAKLILQLDAASLEGFPFPFNLRITYILSATGLQMISEIENTGKEEFPFGLGWHHYFKVGELIDTAVLNFPAVTLLQVNKQMIPTGEFMSYNQFTHPKTIGGTQLDTCFFLDDQGWVKLSLAESATGIKLELSYDTKVFPYLQVYTPQDRRSIALEPMTCAPDALNNHKGIKILKPKEKFSSTFTVNLSR
ncbi:MAG TPA: hypothetical protein VL947_14335 [Cytophagales bacterium]|nr:hypothetical protein [Cytophagales bacterium]